MMQEVSSDENNGESTFEFIERRLEDTHISGGSNAAAESALPSSNRTGLNEEMNTGAVINTPTPLPAMFSQAPAPIPTFAVSALPPPPIALPTFLTTSEPNLNAYPPPNPILTPYNPGPSYVPSQSYSPTAVTSLDLPFSDPVMSTSSSEARYTAGGGGGGVWGWFKGKEFLNKMAEKAKNSVDSVITTLDPQMSEYIYSGGDVQMVVASDKEVKVEAVREAFQIVLGRATVVYGLAARSSVAAQPVGFSAGLKGAEDRISALRQSGVVDEKQPIIAVENTLVEVTPDRWFDVGCLVLDDRVTGKTLHSYTQLVPVPSHCVHQLQNGTPADYPLRWSGFSSTIGQAVGIAYQVPHADWQQHVTGVSRRDMILMAAKVLATDYKRQKDSSGYNQPTNWMG